MKDVKSIKLHSFYNEESKGMITEIRCNIIDSKKVSVLEEDCEINIIHPQDFYVRIKENKDSRNYTVEELIETLKRLITTLEENYSCSNLSDKDRND